MRKYKELPLHLDFYDEDTTATIYVTLKEDRKVIAFTKVTTDPIISEGWFSVDHDFQNVRATSMIDEDKILNFTIVLDTND